MARIGHTRVSNPTWEWKVGGNWTAHPDGRTETDRDGKPSSRAVDRFCKRWLCRIIVRWPEYDSTGKKARRSKSDFPTDKDGSGHRFGWDRARDFQRAKRAELGRSNRGVDRKTLKAFIDEYQSEQRGKAQQALKATSVAATVSVLNAFVRFIGGDSVRVDQVTTEQARAFSRWVETIDNPRRPGTPIKTTTVNKYRRCVKGAFTVAVRMGYTRENPFQNIGQQRAAARSVRYVKPDELSAILDVCSRSFDADKALWWRTFVMVAYTAGLRFNEIVNLTWADIDFADNVIRVAGKEHNADRHLLPWSPKSYESRSVDVPGQGEPISLLAAMLDRQADPTNPYVFIPSRRLSAILDAIAAGTWKRTREALYGIQSHMASIVLVAGRVCPSLVRVRDGIKRCDDCKGTPAPCAKCLRCAKCSSESEACPSCWARVFEPTVTLHDLRRTCITNWIKSGIEPATVMKLAGHASYQTTVKHYHAVTESQREAVRESTARQVAGLPVAKRGVA